MDVRPGYDFCGWVTKSNIRCSDNRIIDDDAFAHCDGMEVPLVWNHGHGDIHNVLGTVLLQSRNGSMYGYGYCNDSESGQAAREAVCHGDITSMSIFANQLREHGNPSHVIHGNIREVSLVLTGANPGAKIENVIMHDGEDPDTEAAIIYSGCTLQHSDEEIEEMSDEKTIGEVIESMTQEQKDAVMALLEFTASTDIDDESASDDDSDTAMEHSEKVDDSKLATKVENLTDEEIDKLIDSLTDEELLELLDDEQKAELLKSIDEGEKMAHNMFENNSGAEENVLMHAEGLEMIVKDAKNCGSMKESYLRHAADYGIENIEFLFPEDHNLDATPQFIKRPTGWVAKVMNGVHHTPFARIKSRFADITEDSARAKGYFKGNLKKDEVFGLLKRSTEPTTIYKKQKMDRDDVVDITDFDVISWLKSEMRLMLDEEIARAILIGDGRNSADDDKIPADHIRPIVSDSDLFVIRYGVATGATADATADNVITAAVKAKEDYQGSGNMIFFTSEGLKADMLLMKDTNKHRIYTSESELATALGVSEIVTVPALKNFEINNKKIYGIMINLDDYTVGADKGGAVNMFDDFDIDYNQQKYLIETRCSGALTKPFSAIVLREHTATAPIASGSARDVTTVTE